MCFPRYEWRKGFFVTYGLSYKKPSHVAIQMAMLQNTGHNVQPQS